MQNAYSARTSPTIARSVTVRITAVPCRLGVRSSDIPSRRVTGFPFRPVSPVLTAPHVQHALAQFIWQRDDGDGDTEILRRPCRPRPATSQKRRRGKGVTQAQDKVRPRVQRAGDPGKLERIGQDLMALRGLRRPLVRPALHQDRPGCVSTIDFDVFAGGDGDRSEIQLLTQLPAEQVQHHSFSSPLPTDYGCEGRDVCQLGG